MNKDLDYLKLLGYIFGSVTLAALIQNWDLFTFRGIAASLIEVYIEVKNAIIDILVFFFENLAGLFEWLPPTGQDLLALFILIFCSYVRSSVNVIRKDLVSYEENPAAFEQLIRDSAEHHNLDPEIKWAEVRYGLLNTKFRNYRHIKAATRWPLTLFRNFSQLFSENEDVRKNGKDVTISFILSIFIVVGITIVLAILSFLPSLYVPISS